MSDIDRTQIFIRTTLIDFGFLTYIHCYTGQEYPIHHRRCGQEVCLDGGIAPRGGASRGNTSGERFDARLLSF